LLVGSKDIGLKVNADKTKYTVMSQDQNAGRSNNINIGNSSFERVEGFKYVTNKNSIQEAIDIRLKSGNACYHSVQKLLSSSMLSKNLKI
jgi:hypothetical protein